MKLSMSTSIDVGDLRKIVERISGQTAGLLRDLSGEKLDEIIAKQKFGDTTRRIDIIAEDYILEMIKNTNIPSLVVTEERGIISIGDKPELIYVIDPLDGSTNYIIGVPWSAVSIGVSFFKKDARLSDIVAGAVAPIVPGFYVYSFARGEGAFYGGSRITVDERNFIGRNILLGYFESREGAKVFKSFMEQAENVKVRSLGCASLEIVYTAIGRAELFMDIRGWLRNVDVAAALGIARELNAYIGDSKGMDISSTIMDVVMVGDVIVARTRNMYEKALNAVRSALLH